MITCRQAKEMVKPFILDQLDDKQLEEFLIHIQTCPDCKEELEIIYTVYLGLMQLNDLSDEEDIVGALKDTMDRSWLHIRTKKLLDVITYAVDALCVSGVLAVLVMQFFMWFNV